ncbi:MAG: hypothetical protein AB7K68_00615 [Bacteriovoracia bacterium]
MKNLIVLTLFIASGFAAQTAAAATCEETVSKAAFEFVTVDTSSLEMVNAVLVSARGNTLRYEVEVFAQYSDGASSQEYPAEFFTVTAKGTEDTCVVKSVKKK